ncbi:hypothetical protein [Nocardia brasiliensis]
MSGSSLGQDLIRVPDGILPIDMTGRIPSTGRYATDATGYAEMLAAAR